MKIPCAKSRLIFFWCMLFWCASAQALGDISLTVKGLSPDVCHTDRIKTHPKKAVELIRTFLKEKDADEKSLNRAEALLGYALTLTGERAEGLAYLESSLTMAEALKDESCQFFVFQTMATPLFEQTRYLDGYDLSFKHETLARTKNDTAQLLRAWSTRAFMLYYLNRIEECYRWQWQINKMALRVRDSAMVMQTANNLTARYAETKNPDSAWFYFRMSKRFVKPTDYRKRAMSYGLMNSALRNGGENQALRTALLDTAYALALKSKVPDVLGYVFIKGVELETAKGNFDKARAWGDSALKIYQKEKILNGMVHLTEELTKLNEKEGNPYKAIEGLKYIQRIRDTLYSLQTAEKMSEFEVKFNTAEKERENLSLKKANAEKELRLVKERQLRNNTLFASVLALLLLAGASGFWFYRNKLKQNRKLAQMEQDRLKAAITAEENERRRIAKELHDGVAQSIAAVQMQEQYKLLKKEMAGESLGEQEHIVVNRLQEIQQEVRSISHNLMPVKLMNDGLKAALIWELQAVFSAPDVTVKNNISAAADALSMPIQTVLYRITQELCINTKKHSKATQVALLLEVKNATVYYKYQDNGKGTDLSKSANGIGLHNLKTRAASVNGVLHITSEKGAGFKVDLVIKDPTVKI